MSVIVPPSRFHCWLDVLPWAPKLACCPDWLPPTFSTLITIPGVCSRITHGSRAEGIASSSSLPKLVPSAADLVSTTGLSPVTVTVSCTDAISMRPLISALKPVWMTMPSWTSFLKPAKSNVTV